MASDPAPQPAIYLSHGGGPWPWMADPGGMWTGLFEWLRALPTTLPRRPEAIVVVTAHWEAGRHTVASGAQPGLIYDYGGFPPETYRIAYPAPGHPEVARRVAELAAAAGIPVDLDPAYGWDHGVFVPIAVSWPEADVPVVAVSLKAGLDPVGHLAFGVALAPMLEENVVIIGSGSSTHDLRMRVTRPESDAFDQWLLDTMSAPPGERAQALTRWAQAPGGTACHPREEHLLPLMVITGAGGDASAARTFHGDVFGHPMACFTVGGPTGQEA